MTRKRPSARTEEGGRTVGNHPGGTKLRQHARQQRALGERGVGMYWFVAEKGGGVLSAENVSYARSST